MYNRLFKDDTETSTDKFKGLLIAFILGNVIIWMVPEIMAQMDDQEHCGSQHIGYLPDNVLTRERTPSGAGLGNTIVPTINPNDYDSVIRWNDDGTHIHFHIDDSTRDLPHPNHRSIESRTPHGANIQASESQLEFYNFFPPAYGQGSSTTCPWEDGASYASRTLHSIVQTILFVVKIIMVLGVIGAVGVMRLR